MRRKWVAFGTSEAEGVVAAGHSGPFGAALRLLLARRCIARARALGLLVLDQHRRPGELVRGIVLGPGASSPWGGKPGSPPPPNRLRSQPSPDFARWHVVVPRSVCQAAVDFLRMELDRGVLRSKLHGDRRMYHNVAVLGSRRPFGSALYRGQRRPKVPARRRHTISFCKLCKLRKLPKPTARRSAFAT